MTVYYERYRNDYDHQEKSVYVDDYEDLEKWIRDTTQEKFYGDKDGWGAFIALDDEYTEMPERLYPWQFKPYGETDVTYYIRMMKNDNNEIIFSDGRYTHGKKFQTKKIHALGSRMYKESHNKNTEFNFAKADTV